MPEAMGPSNDEASSDSSGTDESPMTGASDATGKRGSNDDGGVSLIDPSLVEHQEQRGENSTVYYSDYTGASPSHTGPSDTPLQRADHIILSSSSHARSVSRVDRIVPMMCHPVSMKDHAVTNQQPAVSRTEHANPPAAIAGGSGDGGRSEGHDVSVLVQSALLAHMAALENDNQQLRQKVTMHNSLSCLHCPNIQRLNSVPHTFFAPPVIACDYVKVTAGWE